MPHHEWNWMIVVYLFVGGLGAGSLAISGLAHFFKDGRFRGIATAGALAAPVLVGAGSGLLIFDLGQPLRFWRLFVHINPVSPMSIGSWLLMLFSLVGGLYALLYLPPAWLRTLGERFQRLRPVTGMLAEWNGFGSTPRVDRLRNLLAALGIPLGLGVGIYTGVLLGAIPARPFWNTPMVAQLFLFSALSTASALLMLLVPLLPKGVRGDQAGEHSFLLRADLVFIFLELFILIPFIIHANLSTLSIREALNMILGGRYTGLFWIGVVTCGILVPLVLELAEFAGAAKKVPSPLVRLVHLAVPVLVLVGGYLLRHVFVHAGQDTWFLGS